MRQQQQNHEASLGIKQEPLPYIKREDGVAPSTSEGPSGFDPSPGVSPMSSSMGSVGSPGSPPTSTSYLGSPHMNKMKATSSGVMSGRKKPPVPTPEEEELTNVPTLQMRIKILQQRVSCSH